MNVEQDKAFNTIAQIAQLFFAALPMDLVAIQIPEYLQGQVIFYFYPWQNISDNNQVLVYPYLHYDGQTLAYKSAIFDLSRQKISLAVSRMLRFLIETVVLHPYTAQVLMQTAHQPLESVADFQKLLINTLGDGYYRSIERAWRIRHLFLSQLTLVVDGEKDYDGFHFLAERVAREDFDSYLQFVIYSKIAVYLFNYYTAASVDNTHCPFDHTGFQISTELLPMSLIRNDFNDLLAAFGLHSNFEHTKYIMSYEIYSGAEFLNLFYHDTFSHYHPYQKYLMYNPSKNLCLRLNNYGDILSVISDNQNPEIEAMLPKYAHAWGLKKPLIPAYIRFGRIQLAAIEHIIPMFGHCPDLVWGGIAIREDLALSETGDGRPIVKRTNSP